MEGIIHFYAWHVMMETGGMGGGDGAYPTLFPGPEVEQNRIVMQPFNFMMNREYLVAFLKTASDGHTPWEKVKKERRRGILIEKDSSTNPGLFSK